MERKYPLKDVKKLYGNSAGRCAMPACRLKLILPNTQPSDKSIQIGEIAHIIAHSPTGPRHRIEFAKEKLDTYDNWILLCPTCHQTIDAQESQYSVEKLHQIKAGHEIWVSERLDESMSEVTFAELEIAAKAIASGHHFHDESFHVIPPAEKIKKNGLSQETAALITTGLSRGSEVSNYLIKAAQLDPNFPEILKNGFKTKYLDLKEFFNGDDLFREMFAFANSKQSDFKQQAASLAILTYLFQLCEIFEK